MSKLKIALGFCLTAGMAGQVFAAPVDVGSGGGAGTPGVINPCDIFRVQVDSYEQVLGGNASWSGTANATGCVGSYKGNDKPYPSTINLGLADDGLFNGEANSDVDFNLGVFIGDEYGLQLQSIGQKIDGSYYDANGKFNFGGPEDDPGWIFLGKIDDKGTEFGKVLGQSIITSDFFSCTATGGGSCVGATSGTWALTPPAGGPALLESLLASFGFDNQSYKIGYFDAFAISLKAGDAFAAYLFTASAFGINYVDTGLQLFRQLRYGGFP
ncbi:MAG: hypothetical protein MZV65_53830 [Chromatiales bacterium]|nr:hypothetical protein [Chromatiales bacterium]MCK7583546.1 hypothetical protein [Chromatiales bacterium]